MSIHCWIDGWIQERGSEVLPDEWAKEADGSGIVERRQATRWDKHWIDRWIQECGSEVLPDEWVKEADGSGETRAC
jgi:hypothetical protein